MPPPVADHGGYRIDTNSEAEAKRWVYSEIEPGLRRLGRDIRVPRHPIKLCGPMDALLDALPAGWSPQPLGYFMRARGQWPERLLPEGYSTVVDRDGPVSTARILDREGAIAASGDAAEAAEAFIFDRITVAESHRRRGLGGALMTVLHRQRSDPALPELLTATPEGRALYESLGWTVLSDYSTAIISG